VARLLGKSEVSAAEDSSGDVPALPVHQNPLPDVYPEEGAKK
jgi:hypothetical protein